MCIAFIDRKETWSPECWREKLFKKKTQFLLLLYALGFALGYSCHSD